MIASSHQPLYILKSSRVTRRLYNEVPLAPADVREIRKLLGK